MQPIYWQITANLGLAWAAGGLVGFERSFHGRPAGFRTHAVVALASAAVVMVCMVPRLVPQGFPGATQFLDPSRLAQGVMTGVGFLGAGIIFKEGVNIQGLTTAASIWATAALGLLFGLGEVYPAVLTTAALLTTLIALRWAEGWLPAQVYAWSVFRFRADEAPTEAELLALLSSLGVSMHEVSYARSHEGAMLEFNGSLQAAKSDAFRNLAARLRSHAGLVEFELSRIGK